MEQSSLSEVKARLAAEVDRRRGLLLDVSHRIHARPELNYEERFAHDLLTEVLEAEGLRVERHAGGIETAFRAEAGTGAPTIAVVCEYDALPAIGHACGHNVIAAAGLGAGLAAATLADELGGRLVVLGTPAEEGGGGKIKMIEAGVIRGPAREPGPRTAVPAGAGAPGPAAAAAGEAPAGDGAAGVPVDAALMLHPADRDLTAMDTIAVQECRATYTGRAAHAAAAPQRGRNALDAAVLGYNAVAALRQHIAPGERIHGIFTEGGDKPNIVPARARTEWMVRSPTVARLALLKERFAACLRGGATAAGCELAIEWKDVTYADMVDSRPIQGRYVANAGALGRTVRPPSPDARVVGSTDMGNVSYVTPSIHPMIEVAPAGIPIHTPEFADYARGPEGDRAVVDGAKALAFTVADLWLEPDLVTEAIEEWRAEVAARDA